MINVTNTTIVPEIYPVADAGGPYNNLTGIPVIFDGTGSHDDGVIVSYIWDFGDGATGTGVTPSHTYSSIGTYIVSLTVTDDTGLSNTDYTYATITTPSDPCDFTMTIAPDTGRKSLEVMFWAEPTVGSGHYDYTWDFGDGTSYHKGDINQVTYHTYKTSGTYTVTLTATDDALCPNVVKTQTVAIGEHIYDNLAHYKISIDNIQVINGEYVHPEDDVDVMITYSNNGIYKMKNSQASIFIDELDVLSYSIGQDLSAGKDATTHVRFTVPQNAVNSQYDMRIIVGDDNVKKVVYRPLFVVSQCVTTTKC